MIAKKVNLKEFKNKYLDLLNQIYSSERMEKLVSAKLSFLNRFHLLLLGGKIIFLVNDSSCLCILIKKGVAYFGYLESKDKFGYTKILESGLQICKGFGINQIYTPVDFSIWHSHRYRLNSPLKKNQIIINQPLGQDFYLEVLKELNFELVSKYVTASSDDFSHYQMIAKNKINSKNLSNYSLKLLNTNNIFNLKYFIEIYNLSKNEFKNTPGFYPISFLTFLFIYLVPKQYYTKNKFLYALMDGKKLVGFIYFYTELVESKESMILKTLIISKEHQDRGGYWLLNYIFYQKATKFNCKNVFYAYINTAIEAFKLIPPDCNIDRQYGLFKLNTPYR
jgi:hypothetical protein